MPDFGYAEDDPRAISQPGVFDSATYLADHMQEASHLVIPCIEGRIEEAGAMIQASMYGSILPSAWSFMLAARARGLGTAWTTFHIMFEAEVRELLGIPDTITQGGLFPVAYYTGRRLQAGPAAAGRDRSRTGTPGARPGSEDLRVAADGWLRRGRGRGRPQRAGRRGHDGAGRAAGAA